MTSATGSVLDAGLPAAGVGDRAHSASRRSRQFLWRRGSRGRRTRSLSVSLATDSGFGRGSPGAGVGSSRARPILDRAGGARGSGLRLGAAGRDGCGWWSGRG